MLDQGLIWSNEWRTVEGETLLERAERALSLLGTRPVSDQKPVWSEW